MKDFNFDYDENDDHDDSFIDNSLNNFEDYQFTYDNFNIPEQLLPLSGNDNDIVDTEIYSKISGCGFEAMKLTCDLLKNISETNNLSGCNIEKQTHNVLYPYAFYNKSKKRRPPKTKVRAELLGSLGQANILVAQGNYKKAIDLCLNLIESTPNAWEPLQTLAFVYKESNDYTKYLEYLLACAQIKKNDSFLWGQLGHEFFILNHKEWAQTCYERSLKCSVLYIPTIWDWACINFKSGYIYTTSNILLRLMRVYIFFF